VLGFSLLIPVVGITGLGTTYAACSNPQLSANPPSPSAPESNASAPAQVILTGSATCPGTATFRFWMKNPNGNWTVVQDYSTTNTFTWHTQGLATGTYGLELDARSLGDTAYGVYTIGDTYTLAIGTCTTPTLNASPASPAGTGSTITLTAATSGCPFPVYRFWMRGLNGAWTIIRDYSSSNTTGGPAPGPPGTYGFEVD